jgi:hypothetical protein
VIASYGIQLRREGIATYRCLCSFVEACGLLTHRPRPSTSDRVTRTERPQTGRSWEDLDPESIHAQVLDRTLRLYEQQLWSSDRAQKYLHARGIPDDLARRHRLAYASGRTLVRHLSLRDNEMMLTIGAELGLVIEPPADNTLRACADSSSSTDSSSRSFAEGGLSG